jgi:hypothetical protein
MNPVSSTLHQPVTQVPDASREHRGQASASNFQNSIATNSFPREDVRPPAMKLMKQVAVTIQSPTAQGGVNIQCHPMFYFEAFTGTNGAWVYDCLFTEYRIVTLCKDNFQELMDEQEENDQQQSKQQSTPQTSSADTSASQANK